MDIVIGRNDIALAYNGKLMGRHIYTLPAFTLRIEFPAEGYYPAGTHVSLRYWSKVDDAPTNQWDFTYPYSDWSGMLMNLHGNDGQGGHFSFRVIDAGDLSGVTSMRETFWAAWITETCWFDTRNVTDMNSMFRGDNLFKNPPDFITNKVTDMGYLFDECYSITEAPYLSTENVTNMEFMFHSCTELRHVPLLNVSSLENFAYAFYNCPKVEGGALAMYNAASQKIPSADTSKYEGAFTDCGRDTVTGAAELAQIPESWKAI